MLKVKHVLLVFLLSVIVIIAGSLGKLNYQEWASAVLSAGNIFFVIATVLGVIKLVTAPKFKEFLNS